MIDSMALTRAVSRGGWALLDRAEFGYNRPALFKDHGCTRGEFWHWVFGSLAFPGQRKKRDVRLICCEGNSYPQRAIANDLSMLVVIGLPHTMMRLGTFCSEPTDVDSSHFYSRILRIGDVVVFDRRRLHSLIDCSLRQYSPQRTPTVFAEIEISREELVFANEVATRLIQWLNPLFETRLDIPMHGRWNGNTIRV